ncbi:DUF3489 domain-containing protein [Hydrogenophaga sp.]|uniref:DUF3489 domain-containing protein n=1 Tax=Hydrogenophaga sp. TaxID=1904254 RepID=UPI0039190723
MKRTASTAAKPNSAKTKPKTSVAKLAPSRSPSRVAGAAPSKKAGRQPSSKSELVAQAHPYGAASGEGSTSKQSQVIALLKSGAGASMAQLIEVTGWVPHTVRAMISTALRKRLGLNVELKVEDGVRIYRIVEAASQ